MPRFVTKVAWLVVPTLVTAFSLAVAAEPDPQGKNKGADGGKLAKEAFGALNELNNAVKKDASNAGDTRAPTEPPRGLRLLPYFDAYVVGSHPRDKLFPGQAYQRALSNGQAGNYPVLLVNGMVAGAWQQRRAGRRLVITVEPVVKLSTAQQRELERQAARVGEVLEGEPELTIGPVRLGRHA